MKTRAFKSGNSQAVRLPTGVAYGDDNIELEVSRVGDIVTIFPVQHNLKAMVAELRAMPKPRRAEMREPIEMPDRGDD